MDNFDISNKIKQLQESIDSIFADVRNEQKYQEFCLGANVELNEEEKKLKQLCDDFMRILSDMFLFLKNDKYLNSKKKLYKFNQLEKRAIRIIDKIKNQKEKINWNEE